MGFVEVHQDLFNYEKRRKGFTGRQWAGIAGGVAAFAASMGACSVLLGLPVQASCSVSAIAAMPAICAGWVPMFGMHADEYAGRLLAQDDRGAAVVWEGEDVPPLDSVVITKERRRVRKAYRRRAGKRGSECSAQTRQDAEDRRRNRKGKGKQVQKG